MTEIFSRIINKCQTATSPTTPYRRAVSHPVFKTAHVTPLLKKAGLDRNILKNYQQVSNLSYISKLIEKAVARQINEHIAHKGISNKNQSAYRVFHSTETALLKIQSDIAISMDKGTAVGLVLLDLSAAFDTIDHSILFNCLQHGFSHTSIQGNSGSK